MTDLLPLLQEFYREKLAALLRHQAGARLIAQYDANNTYQYIINREETQLSWLPTAITRAGRHRRRQRRAAAGAPRGKGRERRTPCSRRTRATRRPSSIAGGRASRR